MGTGSDLFIQKLEQVLDGELVKRSVLEPFLQGLEPMLADFERALEYQPPELVEHLSPFLEGISAAFEELRELGQQALTQEEGEEELLFELAEAHQFLNQMLLEFHRESWIFRGPTSVEWVNRVIDAGERFLSGAPLDGRLSRFLDGQVRQLELRLAVRPSEAGLGVLEAARNLSRWAAGREVVQRQQLEDWMTLLIGNAEKADPQLFRDKVSLQTLIRSLDSASDQQEMEHLLALTLAELSDLHFVFRKAQARTEGDCRERAIAVTEILEDLEKSLSEFQTTEGAEDDLEELRELMDELDSALKSYDQTLEGSEQIQCPHCGESNPPHARRCGGCSRRLFGLPSESKSALDYTDVEAGGEEEHVRRIREAVLAFQEGEQPETAFRSALTQVQERLEQFRKSPTAQMLSEHDSNQAAEFEQAVEQLEQGLGTLLECHDPQDTRLHLGLETFMQGAQKLRQLRDSGN